MSDMKTRPTGAAVTEFLDGVADDERRADSFAALALMERVTGEPAAMWGPSMVGFGSYHYRYESGREGDWFLTGFSPRKSALTLYIMAGFERYDELLARLGKFKTGKSCLYVKRLSDVDPSALEELVRASVEHMRRTHSAG
jgi:hypothetical protein